MSTQAIQLKAQGLGETSPGGGASAVSRRILVLGLCAVVFGSVMSWHRRWVCDDAFISYRYALNLTEGRGLVYNEGERVEGYSNFLWTLWCAAALKLGVAPESWTIGWGIVFYSASLGLLLFHHFQLRRLAGVVGFSVPLAVVLGALHDDWTIYATSGLETSFFTFLLIAAYVQFARGVADGRPRPISTGLILVLAALTRPDGALYGLIGAVLLLWLDWPRKSAAALFVLVFGSAYASFLVWRHSYYGDWLPNTYYAKSAHLAWWDQGLYYLWLYLCKYGVLGLGLAAIPLCLRHGDHSAASRRPRPLARMAIVAAAFALPFSLYVTRLGGDFMYARMLIPVTPFYMILLDMGLLRASLAPAAKIACAGLCAAALVLPPFPMNGFDKLNGIANEWEYYRTSLADEARDRRSAIMKRYFEGLPVRVAFLGSEAHAMYRAGIPVAIEAEAGLTDRFIAHQAITSRGRVGHEKNAPLTYLVEQRRAHLIFSPAAPDVLNLPNALPRCDVDLDGLKGWALHWDGDLFAELRRRGAKISNIPAQIDAFIGELDQKDAAAVSSVYFKLKRFYFDFVGDPEREAPFRRKLGLPPAR